ncbi:MAG: hypothetical protein BAJALOKI1v1_430016 [Promethearchaeota archaeon]|nr:MAG: hypothetical protein BAJALOKI1v1_430016 [Candidatus Lokiarchaeota archaeon]
MLFFFKTELLFFITFNTHEILIYSIYLNKKTQKKSSKIVLNAIEILYLRLNIELFI